MEKFTELNLSNKTLEALTRIGFATMTDIQQKSLPLILKRQSLIVKSKTGSGKTHCFLIPFFENFKEEDKNLQYIILAPTRELALQLFTVASVMFKEKTAKITLLTGGIDTLKEISKIDNTQILIGTPQKINEMVIGKGLLNINKTKGLVIDEAD